MTRSIRRGRARSAGLVVVAMAGIALATVGACTSTNALVGKTWQLTSITETVPAFQGVVPADQQANYTVTFAEDGTASVKADCNTVQATWENPSGSTLEITPGASTMAFCGEESMGDKFVAGLAATTSFGVTGNSLKLYIASEGNMELTAAP